MLQALPLQASSSEERELLSLVLRVHELEAERLALQGERELRRHELRRRDLLLMRYDRQRHICDEIITRQRRLIEGESSRVESPPRYASLPLPWLLDGVGRRELSW